VKVGTSETMADDQAIFMAFKDIAKEKTFRRRFHRRHPRPSPEAFLYEEGEDQADRTPSPSVTKDPDASFHPPAGLQISFSQVKGDMEVPCSPETIA